MAVVRVVVLIFQLVLRTMEAAGKVIVAMKILGQGDLSNRQNQA